MGNLTARIENRFRRRPPDINRLELPGISRRPRLQPGTRVIIIGGGIAGSSFARQFLQLTAAAGLEVRVYLVNSTNCNYCGGLVTDLAARTMERLLELEILPGQVLQMVEKCVYVNPAGHAHVEIKEPLVATLRTSRFGVEGFDDSLKERILEGLPEEIARQLTVMEPTIVRQVRRGDGDPAWRVTLSKRRPDGGYVELDGDILVMAAGFGGLKRPMMQSFQQVTGFVPPPVMEASVTELDTSRARRKNIGSHMFIVDNVIPGAFIGLIPKGEHWLTVTALGHKMTRDDIDYLFSHPVLRDFIDLPRANEYLRCHTICPAYVFTGVSPRFYGEGWVAVGDLTGYGRVLKDGYFASFLGTRLAAQTIIYHGAREADFARFYHAPLRFFKGDNRIGMLLFHLDRYLEQKPWFSRLLVDAARRESKGGGPGGFLHAAFRSLATGELSYRLTAALFAGGLVSGMIGRGFPVRNR